MKAIKPSTSWRFHASQNASRVATVTGSGRVTVPCPRHGARHELLQHGLVNVGEPLEIEARLPDLVRPQLLEQPGPCGIIPVEIDHQVPPADRERRKRHLAASAGR